LPYQPQPAEVDPMLEPARVAILCLAMGLPLSGNAGQEIELGSKIAQQGTTKGVAPCMSCHGADGAGMSATGYPRLAGLDAGYLAKQLGDFRSGGRDNPIMKPMAANLTAEEVSAVSAFYASLPVPTPTAAPPDQGAAKTAADLAQWGDWSGRGMPACAQCHAPDGNGIGQIFPGIAGQQPAYIKTQIQAWKSGIRANDPLGLMKTVAEKLTDSEIDALAAYYAAQAGGAPSPARNVPPAVDIGKDVAGQAVHAAEVPQHGAPPTGRTSDGEDYFQPPARDAIPDGPFGDAVRQGQAIFENTNAHPVSAKHVGNGQACGNCHIDAGRLPGSAPLWAAWVAYPAYRTKNKKINTYVERIQGCFDYSMNADASAAGGPPAADSDTIVALVAYSYWLAKGAPTGDDRLPGRGYGRLNETELGFDPDRGAAVYAAKCAVCHGEDGAGVAHTDGHTLFPALWGAASYNWGAGMHAIDTAATFIKRNMPLGLSGSLSDQEAWDVAAFMNSHERPQDPRFRGDLAATTNEFHGGKYDYYGTRKTKDGALLGERPAVK